MVIDTYASLPLDEKEDLVEEIFSDVSLFISSEVPKQCTAIMHAVTPTVFYNWEIRSTYQKSTWRKRIYKEFLKKKWKKSSNILFPLMYELPQ